MYTTYLFDMDGTVLDTAQDICDAVNHTLDLFGQPLRSLEKVMAATGNGARNLMAECLSDGDKTAQFEEIFAEFMTYYTANSCVKSCPYVGIPALLEKLKGKGANIAIVSNKPHAAVLELAEKFFPGIPAFGQRSGIPHKPAPDMVYAALEELGVEKEGAVYVGDSEVDVATAKNAGMPLIAVSWGFRSRALLESLGAAQIADKVEDILQFPR